MRERGLTPMVTLHHFTNPLWVADRGGWLWDEIPERFARFARTVVEALGELCTLWCTINEPMVYAVNGYIEGGWPPGKRSRSAAARVAANMLRGHVAAYAAIKDVQPGAQVGLAQHVVGIRPARPTPWHRLASRTMHNYFNQAFLEAFRTGVLRLPGSTPAHIPGTQQTLDWIGLQYYQEFQAGFSLRTPQSMFMTQRKPDDMPTGPHTWGGLNPGGLFKLVRWLYELLERPIYITEAGVPDPDDSIRPAYLAETVRAAWQAINFNYPVRGLFVWSLLDNFEWAEGYDPRYRFGLYAVDFETQARTARGSAHLYRAICQANGLSSEAVAQYAPAVLDKLYPGSAGQRTVRLKPRPTT
jgi:beta-glucosidase